MTVLVTILAAVACWALVMALVAWAVYRLTH